MAKRFSYLLTPNQKCHFSRFLCIVFFEARIYKNFVSMRNNGQKSDWERAFQLPVGLYRQRKMRTFIWAANCLLLLEHYNPLNVRIPYRYSDTIREQSLRHTPGITSDCNRQHFNSRFRYWELPMHFSPSWWIPESFRRHKYKQANSALWIRIQIAPYYKKPQKTFKKKGYFRSYRDNWG